MTSNSFNILHERILSLKNLERKPWGLYQISSFIGCYDDSIPPKPLFQIFIKETESLSVKYGKQDVYNYISEIFTRDELLNLAIDENSRDHVKHAINVFMLGYYIINSSQGFWKTYGLIQKNYPNPIFELTSIQNKKSWIEIRNEGVNQQETNIKILNFVWYVCSIFHDIGYIIQNLPNLIRLMNDIRKEFPYLSISKIKKSTRISTEDIKLEIKLLDTRIKQIIPSINEEDDLFFSLLKLFSFEEKIDHGLISAIKYLSLMINKEEEAKKNNTGSTYINWYVNRSIALAIALHNFSNLRSVAEKSSKSQIQSFFKSKLKFDDFPIATLLIICDNLQDWGRERIFEGYMSNKIKSVILHNVQTTFRNDRLQISLEVFYYMFERQGLTNENVISSIQKSVKSIDECVDFCEKLEIKYDFTVVSGYQRKSSSIILN